MGPRASAYAALGLEPDADSAAIDRAYRQLIKLHHPDRQGGDAVRAAEITKAYRELRRDKAPKDPLEFNEDLRLQRDGGRRWPLTAVLIGVAVAVLFAVTRPFDAISDGAVSGGAARFPRGHVAAAASSHDAMDQPLQTAEIAGGIQDAVRLSRTRDEFALANETRECQRKLRDRPTVRLLDRCVAFDDAVVQLQDRDPLRDQGPFAELAVTGRQWSAASAMSDDFLAIDSRLDRIRAHVEFALAPAIPPPPPVALPPGAGPPQTFN